MQCASSSLLVRRSMLQQDYPADFEGAVFLIWRGELELDCYNATGVL